jgi:hypothetical protein
MDEHEDTANSDERESQLPEQQMEPMTPPAQMLPQADSVGRWSRSIFSFWSSGDSNDERELLKKKLRESEIHMQSQNERILYFQQQVEEQKDMMENLYVLNQKQKEANDESQAKNRNQDMELNRYQNYVDRLRVKNEKLGSALKNVKVDLKKAKQEIMAKAELINVAQAKLVSCMANDVSTEYPDDMVRSELRSFFEGDFFSWCADMCTIRIAEPEAVAERLRVQNILNGSPSYVNAPTHLQFDINAPDGEASLPALKAALSAELCYRYLADPFFLAMGVSDAQNIHRGLHDTWRIFAQGKRRWHRNSGRALLTLIRGAENDSIEWRIKTMATLESIYPLSKDTVICAVLEFARDFGCLFDADEDASEDLVGIFFNFANLALKIWKRRTTIEVEFLPHLAKDGFRGNADLMEAEAGAASLLSPASLEGRPIALLCRPRIISKPVVKHPTQPRTEITWLKAVAWVSTKENDDTHMD